MELRGSWTGAGKALGKSWAGAGLGLRGSWARAGQERGGRNPNRGLKAPKKLEV